MNCCCFGSSLQIFFPLARKFKLYYMHAYFFRYPKIINIKGYFLWFSTCSLVGEFRTLKIVQCDLRFRKKAYISYKRKLVA